LENDRGQQLYAGEDNPYWTIKTIILQWYKNRILANFNGGFYKLVGMLISKWYWFYNLNSVQDLMRSETEELVMFKDACRRSSWKYQCS
jgi:hypothetical protein